MRRAEDEQAGEAPQGAAEILRARALRLEYATIAWNTGEAVLTIALGSVAGSLALIGFGSVSIIELFASGVVVWHLRRPMRDRDGTSRALRLVAIAFAALAIVLAFAAARDLATARHPGESTPGIVYLGVTTIVMFSLAHAKRRVAGSLADAPLQREALLTYLDGVLSAATMIGLLLNAVAGWWWADPAAALLVAVAAANESREAWEESASMRSTPRQAAADGD